MGNGAAMATQSKSFDEILETLSMDRGILRTADPLKFGPDEAVPRAGWV